MPCEMCGAEGFLVRAEIEGSQLKVCKTCSKYGKVLDRFPDRRKNNRFFKKKEKKEEPEVQLIINRAYPRLLKNAREKMGLKQEEAAKKLSEKESLIHHMEAGQFKPSIALAKKLERFFHIKLIEEYDGKFEKTDKKKSGDLTIGDLIKIKKR